MSSTRPHNMVNFDPPAAEIDWRVWGTPANFNGFRVLPSLLDRRRSTEANQTLHNVGHILGWYTIYALSGLLASCPLTEFYQVAGAKFTLRPNLAFSYFGSVTARHSSSEC